MTNSKLAIKILEALNSKGAGLGNVATVFIKKVLDDSLVKNRNIHNVVGQSEQLVCEYCNEDAKPTCCDKCLEGMVNAVQKAN